MPVSDNPPLADPPPRKLRIIWRHTESRFREYEATLAYIIQQFPLVTMWDSTKKLPDPIMPETYATAIRDCFKSYRIHKWTPSLIDRPRFMQYYNQIVVSVLQSGLIRVGSRHTLRVTEQARCLIANGGQLAHVPTTNRELVTTESDLHELCRIANEGKLSHSTLDIPSLTNEQITQIGSQYNDILLEEKAKGIWILR